MFKRMDGDSWGQEAEPGAWWPWHSELTGRRPDFKADAANGWCAPDSALASVLCDLCWFYYYYFNFLETLKNLENLLKKTHDFLAFLKNIGIIQPRLHGNQWLWLRAGSTFSPLSQATPFRLVTQGPVWLQPTQLPSLSFTGRNRNPRAFEKDFGPL